MTSLSPDSEAHVVEVVLDGELDLSTLDTAQQQITDAEQTGPALLVIDLSRLAFVDSSGVRLVLMAQDRACVAGRRLAVRLGEGSALRVFRALDLLDRIDVLPEPTDTFPA